jgi:DNA-binding transcriptional ArsR family regulator
MTLLDYLLPSKTRQGLMALLVHEGVNASVSDLARRAGVTPAAAQKEVDQMLSAGLVISERQGRTKMVKAKEGSAHVEALRRFFAEVQPGGQELQRQPDETVRAWLGHYGAGLLVTAHLAPQDIPPLEEAVVHGLRLAHHDATVAEVLPVVLWQHRERLDLGKLAQLATKHDETQALGLFLALTGQLGGDRSLVRAAETMRDGRYRRMRYFFVADGRTDLSRELARMHTPKVAKRWHFYLNMPVEGFASHFRKFERAQSVHS